MSKDKRYDIAIVGMMLSSHGGGMPRSMAQQAKMMSDAGHKVTLYIGNSKKMPFTPDQFYLNDSIKIYVNNSIGFWGFGIVPKTTWLLFKNASNHDVIHLNGVWNFMTFFGSIISFLKKTPAIISCRSHYGDYHFTRKPILKRILFYTMEIINLKLAYALHITANWENQTSWRATKRANHIIKIPNPTDLTDFENPLPREECRNILDLNQNGFYIIHLGRTAKQKNLSILIKSIKYLESKRDIHLILAGPPEKHEKKKLLDLCEQLNIREKIIFIDLVEGKDRGKWLAAADIFTLPSHDDNFCIVAIEAAASGTLSIVSPFVGAVEYLPKSMIKICENNQNDWNNIIENYYNNRPAQKVMSDEVKKQFLNETIEQQWIKQYEIMSV